MNDNSKHIVCFISSEICMYLTEIPELEYRIGIYPEHV